MFQLPLDQSAFTIVAIAVVCVFLIIAFFASLIGGIWMLARRPVPLETQIRKCVQDELDGFREHFTGEITRLSSEVRDSRNANDEEMQHLATTMDGIRKEAESRNQQIALTLQNGLADIHRALGVVEGIQRATLLQNAAQTATPAA